MTVRGKIMKPMIDGGVFQKTLLVRKEQKKQIKPTNIANERAKIENNIRN